MSNPFDQFDGDSKNPFDQFDEKTTAEDDSEGASPDKLIDQAHQFVSGIGHSALGAAHGLFRIATGQGMDRAADAINAHNADAYRAPPEDLSDIKDPKIRALVAQSHELPSGTELGDAAERMGAPPALSTALAVLPAAAASTLAAPKGGSLGPTTVLPKPPVASAIERETPQLAQAGSQQSMGAAKALPDMTGTSPELQQAVSGHANPNEQALQAHIDAETLPLPEGSTPFRFRKGQATGDGQQISDEKNMRADPDTNGILAASIKDQGEKLGQSIQEIQRRATPDIVQRNNLEHGQSQINAIKSADNERVTDIRAKYKALADANGGDLPIDTNAVINDIDTSLGRKPLRKTIAAHPVISEIMDTLRSGEPINFEAFEDMRTELANVERGKDGAAATAARIIHNSLNQMPLTADAAPLRDMANTARKAAADRFKIIDQNPAYKAAINDVVDNKNNLHDIGAASPLADSFSDRYFTGNGQAASRENINRIKQIVSDPEFHQSIEAATLNKLRDAAGIDAIGNGNFKPAGYAGAMKAIGNKADALLSPETVQNTEHLKRVANRTVYEPPDSATNRSNTMVTLQRFGAAPTKIPGIAGDLAHRGVDAAIGSTGAAALPLSVVKNVGHSLFKARAEAKAAQSIKDAKLKFAQDAVKPGAGLDYQPPRAERASGGRTGPSDDELVNRLVARWKSAKRHEDAASKPMLAMPDEAVVHALKISGASI